MGSVQSGCGFLYKALDYIAKGKVKVMTEKFYLDDIADAYERVADGKVLSVSSNYELAGTSWRASCNYNTTC
jgi:D-arabinose 1-dehydrogenase-like Zn-dependent alcohol dehydrogenase